MQKDNAWIPKKYLVRVCIYLVIFLVFCSFSTLFLIFSNCLSKISESFLTLLGCILIGGVGGNIYCLRAIYIQACVRKEWDENWVVWYILRPIISLVVGGISYLFIKAGLVIFSSNGQLELNQLSIWSLAFISGLNVDNFIKKIENMGMTIWGITPSRISNEHKEN